MNTYDPTEVVNAVANEDSKVFFQQSVFSGVDFNGPALYEAIQKETDILYDTNEENYFSDTIEIFSDLNTISTTEVKTFVQNNVEFPIVIQEEYKADETTDTITYTEKVVSNETNEEVISFQCGYTENGISVIENVNYSQLGNLFSSNTNNKFIFELKQNYFFDNTSPININIYYTFPSGFSFINTIPQQQTFFFEFYNLSLNTINMVIQPGPSIPLGNTINVSLDSNKNFGLEIVLTGYKVPYALTCSCFKTEKINNLSTIIKNLNEENQLLKEELNKIKKYLFNN